VQDSFVDVLLDCPHYTRPEEYDGVRVPDVLLGGHHKEIDGCGAVANRCEYAGTSGLI
jgi:tRNA (guanine-N1)-methyltransferase